MKDSGRQHTPASARNHLARPVKAMAALLPVAVLVLICLAPAAAGAYTPDTIPPTITGVQPSGTSGISGVVVRIEYYDEAPHNPGSLSWKEVYLDDVRIYPAEAGIPPASCTFTQNSNITCTMNFDLAAGTHTVHGSLRDYGYNTTEFSSTFAASSPDPELDTEPPRLSVTYGGGVTVYWLDYFTFWTSFSDPAPSSGVDPSTAWLVYDGVEYPCELSKIREIKCRAADAERGTHAFSFYLSDVAGNTAAYHGSVRLGITVDLLDDPAGGECGVIGLWDAAARSCTLTGYYNDVRIVIHGDDITLDGNGMILTGASATAVSSNAPGSIIRDLRLRNWTTGIDVNGPDSIISGNDVRASFLGISLNSSGSIVADNTVAGSRFWGIDLTNTQNTVVRGNTVTMDGVYGSAAIQLSNSSGNTVSDNSVSLSNSGIELSGSYGNTITANRVQSRWVGLGASGSGGNLFTENDVSSEHNGFSLDYQENSPPPSGGNFIYRNNFLTGTLAQVDAGSTGDYFSQPLPLGGNFWNGWTGPDSGGDGIVDSPFVFTGGRDDLPWAVKNGWTKPFLSLGISSIYWRDYAAYLAHELNVDFTISNSGPPAAGTQIVGSTCTNSVTPMTQLPLAIGDLETGGAAVLTMAYHVPVGVSSFKTLNYVTAAGSKGDVFEFPGPFPGA